MLKLYHKRHYKILNIRDVLLDFHSFEEFNHKINFYIQRQIKAEKTGNNYQEKLISVYQFLFNQIMSILLRIDYKQYQEFNRKYKDEIENIIDKYENGEDILLKRLDDVFATFLTEYAAYIIPLSNNNISDASLLEAARKVKQVIENLNSDELNVWENITIKANEFGELECFPYVYNPNETRINYLKDKQKTKSRVRTN